MTKKTQLKRRVGASSSSSNNQTDTTSFKYDYSKDYSDPTWPYLHGRMDTSAKIIVVVFPITVISLIWYVWYTAHIRDLIITPLDAPKVISDNMTTAAVDPEKFWGSYRPGVYFGLKTRSPASPVVGLMWMQQFGSGMPPPIRHWCEQGDGLNMYGWFAHDGVNFGLHEASDKYYSISSDFVKRPGGNHGGEWSARVRVRPLGGGEQAVMSLFFYVALDGQGDLRAVVNGNRLVSVSGNSVELGGFQMRFQNKAEKSSVRYDYLLTYAENLAVLKETMMKSMILKSWGKDNTEMRYVALAGKRLPPGLSENEANFIVYQVTVKLPFDMEIIYESMSATPTRAEELSGNVYQAEIVKHIDAFTAKFENTFHLNEKGFDDQQVSFAKAVLSNVLGGLGYFYGASKVQSKYNKEPVDYWKSPLFTGVPSRSFFPRGFLWDEGFHNLLIRKWDTQLSLEIIGHWLDLLNTEGWIPREQILGIEARAKVPDEFVVQRNKNANPPTFFLALEPLVKELAHSDKPEHLLYLQHIFPRLQAWYNWYNTSQLGTEPFSYRWRGRDDQTIKELNPKTLTSGLDDYPRASHPSDLERHVDLRCWMAIASKVIGDIANVIGQPYEDYEATYKLLSDNRVLNKLHWSEKMSRYSDYGLHSDSVKLARPTLNLPEGRRPTPEQLEKVRVTKTDPKYQFVDSTFGYVSLFPFISQIIDPDSLNLGQVLKDIQDPNLLWTNYGLRSLAKSSPLYNKHNTEHDPPYWRGAIWININYLTLKALHHYSHIEGPYQNTAQLIYADLKTNLVNNIYKQFKETGYVWEQYDDKTGRGKGSHPFTGWTALLVNIMAEEF